MNEKYTHTLHIQNVDSVDGTPLLDVKQYLQEFDMRNILKKRWLEEKVTTLNKVKDDGRIIHACTQFELSDGSDITLGFDKLEHEIMSRMRKIYSEKVIDHAHNPRNVGRIKDAEGFVRVTGPCGDTMEITLRIKNDRIVDVAFWTDGCGTSIACGSMTTQLVKGKSITDALKIDSKQILSALGGLPESDAHCALLASNTLKGAIKDYHASNIQVEMKEFKESQS